MNTANNDDFKKYIFENKLRCQTETEMVKTRKPSLILFYMSIHGLSQKAASELIRQNNPALINALLETTTPHYSPENLFFDVGNYHTIVNWLKTYRSKKYPEQDLFWSKNQTAILEHIAKHQISSFGQLDLIRRQDNKATRELILRGKLSKQNELNLAKFARKDNVILLLQTTTSKKDYQLYKQIYIIRFGNQEETKKLLQQRLHSPAEELFFEIAPFNLIERYSKHLGITSAQIHLLNHPDNDELVEYLSKTELCEEAEKLLLKRGEHREIKAYIKTHYLSIDGEITLIKRGHHREIILYLSKRSLGDLAQCELIRRGNYIEIMTLIENYPLAECAVDELYNRGNQTEISLWQKTLRK